MKFRFIVGGVIIAAALLTACGQSVGTSSTQPVGNDARVVADGVSNAPTPTPTPTAPPTAATVPVQAPQQSGTQSAPGGAPQAHNAPPAGTFNRLVGPGVNVGIGGSVGNCHSNFRTVPTGAAFFDICQPGLWFDCHIGTCPAMNGWGIGTVVHYFDGNGTDHAYTIHYVQTGTAGKSMSIFGSVHFQVCEQNVLNGPVHVISS